jgi:hypothetical protein
VFGNSCRLTVDAVFKLSWLFSCSSSVGSWPSCSLAVASELVLASCQRELRLVSLAAMVVFASSVGSYHDGCCGDCLMFAELHHHQNRHNGDCLACDEMRTD